MSSALGRRLDRIKPRQPWPRCLSDEALARRIAELQAKAGETEPYRNAEPAWSWNRSARRT